jgi:hypothetical protein
MKLLSENILDKYNQNGNPCFKVNMDETFSEVSINPEAHSNIVNRIFEAFDNLGFSNYCIKTGAVIGSSITPLSTSNSVVDVAIVVDTNKLFEEVRNKLYSDSTIDALIRSNQNLSSINFNEFPDDKTMSTLVYALRSHILKDCNSLDISSEVKMKVYYIIEPNSEFLDGENFFQIIDTGKRVAKYISNKKIGYIDFVKDVNKKQYYKYIIKPLFNMYKDYKIVLTDLVDSGEISSEHKDSLTRLRVAFDIVKNNRFSGSTSIFWKNNNGEHIESGYNKKPLDYTGTYSYMNILYHHISSKLMSPYGTDFTMKNFFDLIGSDDVDENDLKMFAKNSLKLFGSFDAGRFLSKKFERFEK